MAPGRKRHAVAEHKDAGAPILTSKLAGNLARKLGQNLARLLGLKPESNHRPLHRDKLDALLSAKLGNKLAQKLSA